MVSTSGSSGTLDLPPGDIASPGLAFERDALRRSPAGCRRRRYVGTQAGDAEYAPSRSAQPAVGIAVGAGVKDDHVFAQLLGCGKIDSYAFLGIFRIATGREDCCHRGALRIEQRLPGGWAPTTHADVSEMLRETAPQRRKQHLRLGVSKARVEFEYAWRSIGEDHQAGVEHAFVGGALRSDLSQHRLKDVGAHAGQQLLTRDADGAICAHPTRIRTRVALTESLVVLRGR